MTQAEKQVLHRMLDELEDLRASLVALSQLSNLQVSHGAAQDAKSLAKQSVHAQYAELRKEIDALSASK